MVEANILGNEIAYNSTATIGATSVKISSFKARKSYSFKNTSTGGQIISLAFTNSGVAVAGSGIVLNPNENLVDANSGSYLCWSGDIHAVSSGVGGTIAINEVL